MEKVKFECDYLHGLIWWYTDDDMLTDMPSYIEENQELMNLDNEFMELYSSCYSFDVEDMTVKFDNQILNKYKYRLLKIIKRVKEILNALNDGSFEIVDTLTESLTKEV